MRVPGLYLSSGRRRLSSKTPRKSSLGSSSCYHLYSSGFKLFGCQGNGRDRFRKVYGKLERSVSNDIGD